VSQAIAPPIPEPSKEVLKTKLALEDVEQSPEVEEDGLPDFRRNWDSRNMTMLEDAWEEFLLVKRVFIYVLWQWTQLPGRL
jgi:ERO1-like protein beta